MYVSLLLAGQIDTAVEPELAIVVAVPPPEPGL